MKGGKPMNLRQLEIFSCVSKCKSITEAAKQLYIAQPAVSLAIQQLEQEYNVLLFKRIKQRIYITDEGVKLLQYANEILQGVKHFEEEAKNLSAHPKIRIGVSLSIAENYLSSLLANYAKRDDVSIHTDVLISSEIISRIEGGEYDFGIHEGPILSKENLVYLPLLSDKLCVVCSSKLDIKARLSIEEFISHDLILRDKASGTRQVFDIALQQYGVKAESVCESISNLALLELTKSGLGLGVVSKLVAKTDLEKGYLKELQVEGLEFPRKICLVYNKHQKRSSVFDEFQSYIVQFFHNKEI